VSLIVHIEVVNCCCFVAIIDRVSMSVYHCSNVGEFVVT
jgi:hypothetical protein